MRHLVKVFALLTFTTNVTAETLPVPSSGYVVDMTLSDVISWFENTNDMIVQTEAISTSVSVRGEHITFSSDEFLGWLKQTYDISYYQHGKTIHLMENDTDAYRVIYLDYLTVDAVRSLLNDYELRSSTDVEGQNSNAVNGGKVAILTGPTSYLEIAEGLIAKVEAENQTGPRAKVTIRRAGIARIDGS